MTCKTSNDTEAFRLECEARFVLKMPLFRRRAYLEKIEKRSGLARREALEVVLSRIFYEGRKTKPNRL